MFYYFRQLKNGMGNEKELLRLQLLLLIKRRLREIFHEHIYNIH